MASPGSSHVITALSSHLTPGKMRPREGRDPTQGCTAREKPRWGGRSLVSGKEDQPGGGGCGEGEGSRKRAPETKVWVHEQDPVKMMPLTSLGVGASGKPPGLCRLPLDTKMNCRWALMLCQQA